MEVLLGRWLHHWSCHRSFLQFSCVMGSDSFDGATSISSSKFARLNCIPSRSFDPKVLSHTKHGTLCLLCGGRFSLQFCRCLSQAPNPSHLAKSYLQSTDPMKVCFVPINHATHSHDPQQQSAPSLLTGATSSTRASPSPSACSKRPMSGCCTKTQPSFWTTLETRSSGVQGQSLG